MSKKVVIASACRTAVGSMGGQLSTVPAAEMGAVVIKEALKRAGVAPEQVDHVYMGCVIQAGLGQNVARQMSLKAGLPVEVPAVTLNVVCGSGLNAVNAAADMILAGDADIVVAGGAENMSAAPYALMKARYGYRMNNATMIDTMVNDALWDAFNDYHMGITAENICDQWGITREELDEFAAASQQKACAAIEAGRFKDEIVPIEVKKKKETIRNITVTYNGNRHGFDDSGNFFQVRTTAVKLLPRSSVNGKSRCPCRFTSTGQLGCNEFAVIPTGTHFYGNGDRHGLNNGTHYFFRQRKILHQSRSFAVLNNLSYRAAHIDIYDIGAVLLCNLSRSGHNFRLRPEKLH